MTEPPPHAVWSAVLAVGTAYEIIHVARKTDGTLSAMTRAVFRTHEPAGKAVFIGSWTAFAVWFGCHIAFPERTPSS